LPLNAARGAAAFVLLALPATAMGMTLPLAVRVLTARDLDFGRVLGRLYGLNTLGGVAGVLAAEFVLVPALGIRMSGVAAALLNLAAAGAALRLAPERAASAVPPPPAAAVPMRLQAAAFLAGGALLALEVVWFRLLLLFLFGSSAHFALMLAVVLAGIAGGGLAGSAWLARRPAGHEAAAAVCFAAGAATLLGYLAYSAGSPGRIDSPLGGLGLSLTLMLPTCVLSGALFTLVGRALQVLVPEASAAAGRLTLANTLGAMTGALAGGLLLLPALGAEATLWSVAALYGLAGLLCWPRPAGFRAPAGRSAALGAAAALGLLLSSFPFGRMQHRLLALVRSHAEPELVLVAAREGRGETIQYTRRELFGRPLYYRLLTNGFSMSGTNLAGQRYMGLYAYWPAALHPRAESALLISYGVGVTARALVETPGLRTIDVVDVSREILSLSAIPFGASGDPLRDPRVRVHLEDGRFFLQATRRTFDLVTGEPPPPKAAGIGALYSREYFALLRSRLNPGGLATYWLPVQQLEPAEARAITAGFCDAFPDCTLWTGAGPEWMLAGSNEGRPAPAADEFAAQWRHPVVSGRLRDVALEWPGALAGLFIGDAAFLAEYTRGVPPLTDDRPHRLSSRVPAGLHPDFVRTMSAPEALARFQSSAWVRRHWPEEWRRTAPAAFEEQAAVTRHLLAASVPGWSPDFSVLHRLLAHGQSRTVPRLLLGVAAEAEQIALDASRQGLDDADVDYLLGVRALCLRDASAAAARFEAVLARRPGDLRAARCLVLARVLQGGRSAASDAAERLRVREGAPADAPFWRWFDALAG
jgi:predicted membrane-bound spermidine synthase